MRHVDYIVVGLGLSGLAVAEHLQREGQDILVVDKGLTNASKIAGGMYNPVVLKRFTLAWNADTQLEYAMDYYNNLEEKLDVSINHPLPVYRRFYSIKEQNNWFEASDKPILEKYLDSNIEKQINQNITGEFSFGKVNHAGIIDTEVLLNAYRKYLKNQDQLLEDHLEYSQLKVEKDSVQYKDISAKGIIFCEGAHIKKNPYFKSIDIRPNKGEYLIIESKELKLEVAVKSSIFIIPLANNRYKVGASYDREDFSAEPTSEKRTYIENKLKELTTCDYTIIDQAAGLRPTTKDRRPYIGSHQEHQNVFACNGLGSRGVMTSPSVAKNLVDFMLKETPIPDDLNINRHL